MWLGLVSLDSVGEDIVRDAITDAGGHATLVRAPATLRDTVAVFQPLSTPEEIVTTKVKSGFDPERILNPGRMYKGV